MGLVRWQGWMTILPTQQQHESKKAKRLPCLQGRRFYGDYAPTVISD